MSESRTPAELDRTALDDLLAMTGGDVEFLAEMIDTFLEEGPALVADMRAARTSGDAAALRRAAHTLKSNSRIFGANALSDLCQVIEECAAAGDLDGAGPVIAQAQTEYPAVVAALRLERADA
jgi:HPt (histidine-containing phosphotransfer) domain-containing protein